MKNISALSIILITLIAACSPKNKTDKYNDSGDKDEITVAAYYFPNYHTDDPRNVKLKGEGWAEWELVKAARPRFPGEHQPNVPAWGYTDEKDPKEMAQKIDAAVDNRIDAFIFDWYMYEDGPFLNRCIDEGFLKAENCERIKFGLMWANHDWVDIHPYTKGEEQRLLYPGIVSPNRFDEICDFVIKEYFVKPNYWKIDSKPISRFMMYKSLLKALAAWKQPKRPWIACAPKLLMPVLKVCTGIWWPGETRYYPLKKRHPIRRS